jgi:hypothetical protein
MKQKPRSVPKHRPGQPDYHPRREPRIQNWTDEELFVRDDQNVRPHRGFQKEKWGEADFRVYFDFLSALRFSSRSVND